MKIIKNITLVALLIGCFALAGHYDANYTKKDCQVIATTANTIVIEDPQGHIWHYEGTGFVKNEIVNLKMHTNNTNFIEDDVIKKIEKNS